MTTAALVVVNYGSHALLAANVPRSVLAADAAVVVVDSFFSDAEREAMTRLAAEHGWELVTPSENVGFGGGVNLGMARALERQADAVVILNPDAWLPPGGFSTLITEATEHPMALVAPLIDRPDGSPWSRGLTYLDLNSGLMRSAARPPRSSREVPWLSGACLALSAGLWNACGGFDEDYFLYWEDVDFSARVTGSGGTLRVLDTVHAVHDEGSTHTDAHTGPAKSATYYRYNTRNRLLYAAKHLPPADRKRWRTSAWAAGWQIVLQGGRRQLVTSIEPWRAIWTGTREGLRLSRPHRLLASRARR